MAKSFQIELSNVLPPDIPSPEPSTESVSDLSFCDVGEPEAMNENLLYFRLNHAHRKLVEVIEKQNSDPTATTKIIPGPKRKQAKPINSNDKVWLWLERNIQEDEEQKSSVLTIVNTIWCWFRSYTEQRSRHELLVFLLTLVGAFVLCLLVANKMS